MNRESPVYIIGFITAVSLFFGLIVSVVNYATADMLKRNEEMHRNRILAEAFLLAPADSSPSSLEQAVKDSLEERIVKSDRGNITCYVNRKNGDTGLVFSGTGFWDRITGIIVLAEDLTTVRNIQFFEHKETPGLGARIEEKSFTGAFRGLTLMWNNPPASRIIIGPPGEKAPNRVDAITGATQTSLALMDMVNRDLENFRKAVNKEGE